MIKIILCDQLQFYVQAFPAVVNKYAHPVGLSGSEHQKASN